MNKISFLLIAIIFLFCLKAQAQDSAVKLNGKILLQVESMGQAWYVSPEDGQRHYLGRPADAFRLMRELGLGVTEADYGSFHDKAPLRLAGRILLRVQASGEAYYVHPSDLSLHYLGRPADALEVMRKLGLGITNIDLVSIPIVITDTTATSEDLQEAQAYVASDILGSGSKINIEAINKEGDFYRIVLRLTNGQALIFYLAKNEDGFKPAVMNMNAFEEKIGNKPEVMVELFVMSYCPYGLQIEKGILPVLETLVDKIDFKLEFVDYAMHGQTELDEQLRQYCIREKEPEKLTGYLECFVEAGDSGGCLERTGVDPNGMEACLSEADNRYQVTEKFNDPTTWMGGHYPVFDIDKNSVLEYGIEGSPTLVINGVKAVSGRDPASLLGAICSNFEIKPDECTAELSGTVPAPGFGLGSGNGTGSCGS